MADGFVQVAPDSTGKKIDNEQLTVAGQTVYRQRTQIAGKADVDIAKVGNGHGQAEDYGVFTREARRGAPNVMFWENFLVSPVDATRWTSTITGTGAIYVGPTPAEPSFQASTGTLPSEATIESIQKFEPRSSAITLGALVRFDDPNVTLFQTLGVRQWGFGSRLTSSALKNGYRFAVEDDGKLWARAWSDSGGTGALNVDLSATYPRTAFGTTQHYFEIEIRQDRVQWRIDGAVVANYYPSDHAQGPYARSYPVVIGAYNGTGATLAINHYVRAVTVTTHDVVSLPAGTNNIGDVDVLTLPAIPAGNNNIGDVDVASLPALPAGTNNIGDVDVISLPALPAGNNNIGDVDANLFQISGAAPSATNPLPTRLTNGSAFISRLPVDPVPTGSHWQIKGSLTFTPTVLTDTFPPKYVLGWKVPTGKSLTWQGGVVHNLAATLEYYRVCRRYFLYGYQATAAPAAPASPTAAAQALTSGINSTGNYSWKVAPIDTFRREGPVSTASASLTMSATIRGATITPPAPGTGVTGYNIYRCTANNDAAGPWYFVGSTPGATPYIDAEPDAALDLALVPSNTWTVGEIVGETMAGPGEVIIEVGAVALTGAPTHIVYKGTYGQTQQAIATTFPTTVGQRIRAKTSGETINFVPVPTAAANLWRGNHVSDVRTRHEEDFGVTAVTGINAAPSAGAFIVWGYQVIGIGQRGADPVAATIHAYSLIPFSPNGVVIPALGEIVVEVAALSAGVAGVRDFSLFGTIE